MFTITAYPKAAPGHRIKQTATSVQLLKQWRIIYALNNWVVHSVAYTNFETSNKYLCSACKWRGDYPLELADKQLCPQCNSAVRRRANYPQGAL